MTMPAAAAAATPRPRRAAMSVAPNAIDTGGNVHRTLPSLRFGLGDLARAMYCVGRINYRRDPPSHALPHQYGPSANQSVNVQLANLLKCEWASRLELVPAYCAPQSASTTHGSQLVLSEIVSMLDSSEKGSFAYFLGQAFTWMYCEDRLRPCSPRPAHRRLPRKCPRRCSYSSSNCAARTTVRATRSILRSSRRLRRKSTAASRTN